MAYHCASDFISNYDSYFAPTDEDPLYSPDAVFPLSRVRKLVTFLIQMPIWIVVFFLAAVIYAQVFHSPVTIGPAQIRPVLIASPIAPTATNEDIKQLAQKLDAL